MATEATGLIGRYASWLEWESSEREIGDGWSELTFPFLDRHNDHLQVFVRRDQSRLRITDEGRMFRDLEAVGCDVSPRSRRRAVARKILDGLGLDPDPDLLDSGVLSTTAADDDFPRKLHGILLAMLALDGLARESSECVATIPGGTTAAGATTRRHGDDHRASSERRPLE